MQPLKGTIESDIEEEGKQLIENIENQSTNKPKKKRKAKKQIPSLPKKNIKKL